MLTSKVKLLIFLILLNLKTNKCANVVMFDAHIFFPNTQKTTLLKKIGGFKTNKTELVFSCRLNCYTFVSLVCDHLCNQPMCVLSRDPLK